MLPEFRKEVFFDMETTELSPFDSQIISIQVRVDGRDIVWPVWEGSEREVVGSFLSFTEEVFRLSTRFIGYSVLKFDVSFLTERMHSLGLLTFGSWERLNRELNWFDLYRFLGDRFGRFREWKLGVHGEGGRDSEQGDPPCTPRGSTTGYLSTYTRKRRRMKKCTGRPRRRRFAQGSWR